MPWLMGSGIGLKPPPGAPVFAQVYIASTRHTAWSAGQTVLQLATPSAKTVEILRVHVTQETLSSAAIFGVQLYRGGAAVTWSAPTVVTVVPLTPRGRASSSVVTAWGSSVTDGAGAVTLSEEGWNVTTWPYQYLPAPEETIQVVPGGFFCVKFLGSVPSATYTIAVVFREVE